MFWNKHRPDGSLKGHKNHSIQDVCNHVKLSNIYKLEADIFQELTMFNFKFQFQVLISSFIFKFNSMFKFHV